jgi:hypothetical protein
MDNDWVCCSLPHCVQIGQVAFQEARAELAKARSHFYCGTREDWPEQASLVFRPIRRCGGVHLPVCAMHCTLHSICEARLQLVECKSTRALICSVCVCVCVCI